MRILKIAVWIFILYIIQSVFGNAIEIYNAVPALLPAFAVLFSYLADNDKEAVYVILICGILSGSLVGNSFAAEVLITGSACIVSHWAIKYIRFIPDFIRVQIMAALTAIALAAAQCFIANMAIELADIKQYILPAAVYTLICSFVMYPILIKTLFGQSDKILRSIRKELKEYE